MGFHHVSLATRDLAATHRFYTELMGFELVHVQTGPTPDDGGWGRLAFYDTGGNGMMSFWELHDHHIGTEYETDLSESVGLPIWVNHLAFDAPTLADLEARRQCWQAHGIAVLELDFGHSLSIYALDPNRILVEFSCTHGTFPNDPAQAARDLFVEQPPLAKPPTSQVHPPLVRSQQ